MNLFYSYNSSNCRVRYKLYTFEKIQCKSPKNENATDKMPCRQILSEMRDKIRRKINVGRPKPIFSESRDKIRPFRRANNAYGPKWLTVFGMKFQRIYHSINAACVFRVCCSSHVGPKSFVGDLKQGIESLKFSYVYLVRVFGFGKP